MNEFRTEVHPPEFSFSINHGSVVSMMGSCFAANMGEKLRSNKIAVNVNPFGILFNPFSIMNALERMLNRRPYTIDELTNDGEKWISFDHHGAFSKSTADETLAGINSALQHGADHLEKSDVLFITPGSAWVYHHRELKRTVANCHKVPNGQFEKRLLSMQDCHLIMRHIPQFLTAMGLKLEIVFTVSPIRHWKDGAIENQRSKSHLISAIHAVVDEFPNCHYFPAYELLMDDLRDYRFYESDMLHPSKQAIEYVWNKFGDSFFNDETRIISKELQAVVKAVAHRPMDPESNSYQRFLKKQLDIISLLEKKYPMIDLETEREHFQAYLL